MAKPEDQLSPQERSEVAKMIKTEQLTAIVKEELKDQLRDPPSSFQNYVEQLVEKRTRDKLLLYAAIGVGAAAILGFVGWNTVYNAVTERVSKEVFSGVLQETTNELARIQAKAKEDWFVIGSHRGVVESMKVQDFTAQANYLSVLNSYSNEARLHSEFFVNQIAVLRSKGYVVAMEELPKLIRVQTFTNLHLYRSLPKGHEFVFELDDEPFSESISLKFEPALVSLRSPYLLRTEGKRVIVAPSFGTKVTSNSIVRIEYVKKISLEPRS